MPDGRSPLFRLAPLLFGAIAALGPAVALFGMAIVYLWDLQNYGEASVEDILTTLGLLAACAVAGGRVGRPIRSAAVAQRQWRVVGFVLLFPVVVYAAGAVTLLCRQAFSDAGNPSPGEAVEGVLAGFLYFLFSLYLPYALAAGVAASVLYHRAVPRAA